MLDVHNRNKCVLFRHKVSEQCVPFYWCISAEFNDNQMVSLYMPQKKDF